MDPLLEGWIQWDDAQGWRGSAGTVGTRGLSASQRLKRTAGAIDEYNFHVNRQPRKPNKTVEVSTRANPRCLIPRFDGATFRRTEESHMGLKFLTVAPRTSQRGATGSSPLARARRQSSNTAIASFAPRSRAWNSGSTGSSDPPRLRRSVRPVHLARRFPPTYGQYNGRRLSPNGAGVVRPPSVRRLPISSRAVLWETLLQELQCQAPGQAADGEMIYSLAEAKIASKAGATTTS